ncbi:UNVERIFIED_CONTAM: hypothetical protein GTU68_024622, partial [Idotea baltica]|nr:hypothetical protein [Idotea baltica]
MQQDLHEILPPQSAPANAYRGEAVPVPLERLRLEVRPVRRADAALPEAHRGSPLPVPPVRESLFQVGSPQSSHEETRRHLREKTPFW